MSIPVIGNGDITEAEDALRMLTMTGCDAVMVGRAAMGNPLLFRQIKDLLDGRSPGRITPAERTAMMTRFLNASVEFFGEKRACFMMRSRLAWFARGLPRAGRFRTAIRQVESRDQAVSLIGEFAAAWCE